MAKKENQRVKLTKRLLQESLLALLEKKELGDISVSELCAAAEINRSTFYNHYGCPADVLLEIEERVVDDLEQIWQRETARADWPLARRFEALCDYLLEHRSVAKLLFRSSELDQGFAALIMNAAHVRTLYEREFAWIEDPDSRQLVINFYSNGAYQMVRKWLLEDIPKTPREMGELAALATVRLGQPGSGGKPDRGKG